MDINGVIARLYTNHYPKIMIRFVRPTFQIPICINCFANFKERYFCVSLTIQTLYTFRYLMSKLILGRLPKI